MAIIVSLMVFRIMRFPEFEVVKGQNKLQTATPANPSVVVVEPFVEGVCIDRACGGDGGRFVFYRKGQTPPAGDATPVEVEGDHVVIVVRIDIKSATEHSRVRSNQNAIRVVDAPEATRS